MSDAHRAPDFLGLTTGYELFRGVYEGAQALWKFGRENPRPEGILAIQREFELLKELAGPGIAQPLACIQHMNRYAIVCEDVPGLPLASLLTGQPIKQAAALEVALHLARTLSRLHANHIVYQDLRPANILVDLTSTTATLVDFSTAITGHRASGLDWPYISPEQTGRVERPTDVRTDLYSLGIILYQMLTGSLPFYGRDPLEWAHAHLAHVPVFMQESVKDVSPVVRKIVMRLLAKLPEQRYHTATGLAFDLENCVLQLKNCEQIAPFEIGSRDVPARLHVTSSLYGRESERECLRDVYLNVAATGKSVLLTVTGESGVGKSSLARELQIVVRETHGYFISGKFDQLQRNIPYATLVQALNTLVHQILSESEERVDRWRKRILDAVGSKGQLLVDMLPQIAHVIGKQPAVAPLPALEEQLRFQTVIREFLGIFATPEHPLVLFLDDVHWIDPATISVVEHLLTSAESQYLMIVEAYRNGEVGKSHPLAKSLRGLRQRAKVNEIELRPLDARSLNKLTADTLRANEADTSALTAVIFDRTNGNPFFFKQYLDALHRDGVLSFDPELSAWKWDVEELRGREFADNAVALMVEKLKFLPHETQQLLQFAACLGNKFDMSHLSLVTGRTPHYLVRWLYPAVDTQIIVHQEDVGKFLHDKIRDAAYSLIPSDLLPQMHLNIGRTLCEHLTPPELDIHIFEAVGHLNRGAALVTGAEERETIAELNLLAGKKAKTSAAHATALAFFNIGAGLISDSTWRRNRDLAFGLEYHVAEAEFLTGHPAPAEKRLESLGTRSSSILEKAAITRLQSSIYMTTKRTLEAVAAALDFLRTVGIDIPIRPREEDLRRELDRMWTSLGARDIEELIGLPAMTSPDDQAIFEVLEGCCAPAIFTGEHLYGAVVCRLASFCLERGHCDSAGLAYIYLARFLCDQEQFRVAERFGQLGANLVAARAQDRYGARVSMGIAGYVNHWSRHLRTSMPILESGFEYGRKSGDLTYMIFNGSLLVTTMIGYTNDPALALDGTISSPLGAGDLVRIYDGATLLGTANVVGTSWTFTTPTLADGAHNLTAVVQDAAGNSGTASAVFVANVDTAVTTTAVTLSLSPDNGISSTDRITNVTLQTIGGTLSANLGAHETVELSFNNGSTWQSATATAGSNTFSLANVSLSVGTSDVLVRVVDQAGNEGNAQTFSYTIDTTRDLVAASPTITDVTDNFGATTGSVANNGTTDDTTPTITGTNPALTSDQVVRVYSGSTLLGQATVDAGGTTWSITPTVQYATHVIKAQVEDKAGNVAILAGGASAESATRTFSLNAPPIDLANVVNGTAGFLITPHIETDNMGNAISAAGDVNGDGLSDLIIGAHSGSKAYVVFGKTDLNAVSLTNVASGTGSLGYVINGYSLAGVDVSAGGDANGDGYADVVVAVRGSAGSDAATYVVHGKQSTAPVTLGGAGTGYGHYLFNTPNSPHDLSFVGGGRDFTNDGVPDVLMGVPQYDTNPSDAFSANFGRVYVAVGRTDQLTTPLEGAFNGFIVSTTSQNTSLGTVVTMLPDVNGDGIADMALGEPNAVNGGGVGTNGRVTVIYGKTNNSAVNVSGVGPGTTNGFTIFGKNGTNLSVNSSAGDFNGDGLNDVIVGSGKCFRRVGCRYGCLQCVPDLRFAASRRTTILYSFAQNEPVVTFRDAHGRVGSGTAKTVQEKLLVMEVSSPYEIAKVGELYGKVALVIRASRIYSGRAVVVNAVDTGLTSIVSVALMDEWVVFPERRVDAATFRQHAGALAGDWRASFNIRKEYHLVVSEMRAYLSQLARWGEEIDSSKNLPRTGGQL